ncbi:MAG TPA: hypothetical protein PK971_00270 [Saprospiraceae bacterium]|nr:hypothetical protein [Saprospiraceae bacterium]HND86724.1 hypothetical protein [Saprospiraceae bacterium]HNG89291.1 hypothetical protein [Saprospiraceae bacterium]
MNLNTQFVFEGKTKRLLFAGMALGAICLVLIALNDDQFHTRFWTTWLHNTVFFTGIAFTAMFFLSAQITAFAGWMTVIKRVWEAMSQFMFWGLLLLLPLVAGVWMHLHHLYHWNVPGITDPNNPLYDRIIAGKSGFLNPMWYTFGTLGVVGLWYFWAMKLRQASVDQDTMETPSFDYYKKQRKWAASFLPLGGFLSTVFLWQTLMSVDPHWYSTMFAWYSMISLLLGAISLFILLVIYLKSKGYMEYVTPNHLHDVGKFLFGISVFWTYLWFDQYMLIWYANNGEETIYFNERMNHYPVLFWGNLLLNFITPFLILMRNDTKRKMGTMFFVALIVFFGHWWDYFYMIKPGARIAAHEAMEIKEGKKDHSTGAVSHTSAPAAAEHSPAAPAAAEAHADTAHPAAAATHGEAAAHDSAAQTTAEQHETPAAEANMHASSAGHAAEGDAHAEAHDAGHHDESKAFKLGYTIPGLDDLGAMIGFLSLFLFLFFRQMESASLVPMRDPYLEESLHHDTGALIATEQEDGHGHHDDHHH